MKKLIFVFAVLLGSCLLALGEERNVPSSEEGKKAPHELRLLSEYSFPECRLIQFHLGVLSAYSYLIVSDGKAVCVDPGLELEPYLSYVKTHKLELIGVFLTHSHADFVAGHMEYSRRFGLPVYISHRAGAEYKHHALKANDVLRLGKIDLKFLETPGHTLDGMCLLAQSLSGKPLFLLTGDTLFAGSVGRPDLMGGTIHASTLAEHAYDSWKNVLSGLPDDLPFFPAHGAGSLCGSFLRSAPFSTIGTERRTNPYLKATSKAMFTSMVLSDLAAAPRYFAYNAALNRKGPPAVLRDFPVDSEKPSEALTDPERASVVDIRSGARYADGHIPNSRNIALRGRFETWVGTLIPVDKKIVLVADDPSELKEGIRRLARIGYPAKGLLYSEWVRSKLPSLKLGLIVPDVLKKLLVSQKGLPVLIDVRSPEEFRSGHIEHALSMPLNDLKNSLSKLSPDLPVILICESSYRANTAVGILERLGFRNLTTFAGGMGAWKEENLPVVGSGDDRIGKTENSNLPLLLLPGRISAEELAADLRDIPNHLEVVDLRPPRDFADYSIPGSVNRTPEALLAQEAGAGTSKRVLILIDRDGSYAMAVGGILAQKTSRPVKVLRGGLEAFWRFNRMQPSRESMRPSEPEFQKEKRPSAPPSRPSVPRPAGC